MVFTALAWTLRAVIREIRPDIICARAQKLCRSWGGSLRVHFFFFHGALRPQKPYDNRLMTVCLIWDGWGNGIGNESPDPSFTQLLCSDVMYGLCGRTATSRLNLQFELSVTNLMSLKHQRQIRGCISGGVYVPCIYSLANARWELPFECWLRPQKP